jgi:hypothetical protein
MKYTTHFAASLAACVLAACGASQQPTSSGAGESHAQAAADFERGPHRGRLLRDGDFSLELQIFEDGVPPEFHVFLFEGGKPLAPSAAQVSVDLTRLDGEVNTFAFAPDGDFLRGNGVVHEPHSFSVNVQATRNGKTSRWHFDSFEGRVAIPAATAKEAGTGSEPLFVIADYGALQAEFTVTSLRGCPFAPSKVKQVGETYEVRMLDNWGVPAGRTHQGGSRSCRRSVISPWCSSRWVKAEVRMPGRQDETFQVRQTRARTAT